MCSVIPFFECFYLPRALDCVQVKAMQLVLSFSDTVVHMDADALIVNTSMSFTSLLASLNGAYQTANKDIVYTTDFQMGRVAEPTPYSLINTGVYVMHSTNWTKVRHKPRGLFRYSTESNTTVCSIAVSALLVGAAQRQI